jgi:glycosyltransferase involved in cell wall biosynthesis
LPAAVRTGWRLIPAHGIEAISAQDPFLSGLVAYLIARRYGLPLSVQFAADMVDNPYWLREKPYYPILNHLAHFLIRRAATFRVVSQMEAAKLRRLGIPEDRIWNLGWISDFSRFLAADGQHVRVRFLHDGYRRLLLFVGRLAPQKDLGVLLTAFAHVRVTHPDTRLLIVGEGPLRVELEAQAERIGLDDSVVFVGAVSYTEVPSFFAAADLFVLSSIYEGNARVLAEAAAAALPAVSTAVSGSPDTIVDGATGRIVPVGDAAAFARAVNEMLDDPARLRRLGKAARAHILALYETDRLLAGFAELWEATAHHGR